MTDQALRRTDDLLTELVELIETARALPMSSSIVVPRERVLDLLDELRETMPPEMNEARRTVATRDSVLHAAYEDAERSREQARLQAEQTIADAARRAGEVLAEAEDHAREIIAAGRREHDGLIGSSEVFQAAARAADEAGKSAEDHAARVRRDADGYAAAVRGDAEAYAAKIRADADDYTDRTLADLAHRLQRAAGIAEQGRVALSRRRATRPQADVVPTEPANDMVDNEAAGPGLTEPGPTNEPERGAPSVVADSDGNEPFDQAAADDAAGVPEPGISG